jgi:hypothetical protein
MSALQLLSNQISAIAMWTHSVLASALCFLPMFRSLTTASHCEPWTMDKPNRIFVLTDIANEPDDTMSLIRLLSHSDMYTVEGLVAITSFWLPNATYPEHIQTLVDAYSTVYENLQSHSNYSFPTAKHLTSKVASGPTTYGMQALFDLQSGGNLTSGAQLLIAAVDASEEPLYIQAWGGTNTLATALWHIKSTRSSTSLSSFIYKIRVYTISDQDDTGPWIRYYFPSIRYIASRAGFDQYSIAAWTGISSAGADPGGPNAQVVSQAWLTEHIQVGPLGKLYPDVLYIMEGDTPALLFNTQTGLGDAEHPSWGSWGGRYGAIAGSESQYGDAVDVVKGANNRTYNTNHAAIWRWREAFQSEFAARIQWTLTPYVSDTNATHPPIVVVNESCGSQALNVDVHVGETVVLNASASWSPDEGASLNFTWFQYVEPSSFSTGAVQKFNFTEVVGSEGRVVELVVPESLFGYCVAAEDVTQFGQWGEAEKCLTLHVVLAVKDDGREVAMTRYRRVLLNVQPYDGRART